MEHICNGGTGLPPGVMPEALFLASLHAKAKTILDQSRPQCIDPSASEKVR
jgi:hypothetical protein